MIKRIKIAFPNVPIYCWSHTLYSACFVQIKKINKLLNRIRESNVSMPNMNRSTLVLELVNLLGRRSERDFPIDLILFSDRNGGWTLQ